jgi:hypothetical protein
LLQARRNVDLVHGDRGAGNARQFVEDLDQVAMDVVQFYAGFGEDGLGESAFLFEQGYEEVLDFELLLASLGGEGLGGSNALLELFGEAVEVHMWMPPVDWILTH